MSAYEAGVIDGGRGHVVWSQHRTAGAARRAARKYARRSAAAHGATGYAGAWSGFWRAHGGEWREQGISE